MSAISLGSFVNFKDFESQPERRERAEAVMLEAYELGINFFDGAEAYGRTIGEAESFMGSVIERHQWPRNSFIVSAKAIIPGHGPEAAVTAKGLNRKHLIDCVNESLERYRLDYIDIFFCHRPDPGCPLEETCWAMNDLIRQGKIAYWAVSCHLLRHLMEVYRICDRDGLSYPVTEQIMYNVLWRDAYENETRHFTRLRGLGITAWGGLEFGLLSGKYLDRAPASDDRHSQNEWFEKNVVPKLPVVRELRNIAESVGVPLSVLSLALVLRNPEVSTVIVGASRPEQIRENAAAAELSEQIDGATIAAVDEALSRHGYRKLIDGTGNMSAPSQ